MTLDNIKRHLYDNAASLEYVQTSKKGSKEEIFLFSLFMEFTR